MIIWIESGEQRQQTSWALISNGYSVRQIVGTDPNFPIMRKRYGLEYEEPEEAKP